MPNYQKHFIETSSNTRICIKSYQPTSPTTRNSYPVILVHGLLNTSELFDVPGLGDRSLVNALINNGHAVYTYDQRGCGESSTPDWEYGLKENVLIDLPAVMRFCLAHSGQERMILGGFSLGGIIIYCFYSVLLHADSSFEGLVSSQIDRIFTIAAPGIFYPKEGRWKNLFKHGLNILQKSGPFIDRAHFIQAQISINNPALGQLFRIPLVNFCMSIAKSSILGAALIKSLPIRSVLYSKADMDIRTFFRIIRSRVLDRTSTHLLKELFNFATTDGSINLIVDGVTVTLPESFLKWENIPVLLISSSQDQLISPSEVEIAHQRIGESIYLNVDLEFGQGCGHAGYFFKDDLNDRIWKRVTQFLSGV